MPAAEASQHDPGVLWWDDVSASSCDARLLSLQSADVLKFPLPRYSSATLGYITIRLRFRTCFRSQLPLRPDAQLQWLGFSSAGQLFAHDTLGSLFALKLPEEEWAFAADTKAIAATGGRAPSAAGAPAPRHDARDSYWPVGVLMVPSSSVESGGDASRVPGLSGTTSVPSLMAVLCKGAADAPAVTMPRPLTVPLALQGVLVANPMSEFEGTLQVGAQIRCFRMDIRALRL
jgi:hypothetical protein